MSKAKLIILNSFIYSLSTLLSKAVAFLLLPIFTYYLTKEDYGIIGIITSITTITSSYIGLNPNLFLIVKGHQYQKAQTAIYIYHAILLAIISFFLVSALLFSFHDIIFSAELTGKNWLLIMIALYSLCNTNIKILDTVFQLEKKAVKSSMLQLSQSFLSLGLASLLIIRFAFHWEGLYFSDFVVTLLLSIYSLSLLYKKGYITIRYDNKKIKELFHYLFPLTFHVLGFVMIGSADKLFISKMIDLKAVGIYNIACTVGLIIGLIHDSLLKAWNPFFFEEIYRNDIRVNIKIIKFTYLYYTASFIIIGVFILVVPYIFKIMINDKFNEALPLVPFIGLGYTILGMRNTMAGYLYHANKINLIASLSVLTGGINICLNYFFIRLNGLQGAAEAMLYSYIILFILTFIFANKYNRIPWLLK